MRLGLSWAYGQMCVSAKGGAADVDAWLAGDPLPSDERARESRLDDVVGAGAEVG